MSDYGLVVRRLQDGERVIYQKTLGKWKPVRGRLPTSLVEESYQNYNANPELAESEFIELEQAPWNQQAATETTALLGGSTATSAATGPGSAAVAGGIIVGGLTVGTGIALAVKGSKENNSDRNNPKFTLPEHKFLGPGNDADNDDPLDIDDKIAKDHDHDYSKAKTQEDIQIADDIAIEKFNKDWQETGNIHSALGAVGLGIKRLKERVTGVKYPSNLPSSAGMAKFPVHSDPRKQPDWKKRNSFRSEKAYINWIKYTWAQWNKARVNRGLPRVWPPSRVLEKIGVTHKPPSGGSNEAISFRDFVGSDDYDNYPEADDDTEYVEIDDNGPLLKAFAKARERNELLESQGLGHRKYNDPELNALIENWDDLDFDLLDEFELEQAHDGGQISSADFDDRNGAGPSTAEEKEAEAPEEVPEEATMTNKRKGDPQAGAATKQTRIDTGEVIETAAGSGHNSASDGGFDSAQGPESYLPKGGYKVRAGQMMIEKVHRLKMWAIPYTALKDDTFRDGADLITTPLAELPVQYIFWYMSPEEFDLIPAGSFVHSVKNEIMQTVATTGYPVGGTTATVTTTNHPKVLVIGEDLEAKCRGGVNRLLKLSSNMIPGLAATPNNYDDFIQQAYGSTQGDATVIPPGVAFKIPWYNKNYFCVYQPNAAQAAVRGFNTPDNKFGFEYFQNMITEVNSNDTTWDHVHTYHYKFENAPIGKPFRQVEILTDSFDQSVGSGRYYNMFRNVNGAGPSNPLVITESIEPSAENLVPLVTYKSAPMEKGSFYVRGDAPGKPARQPTLHIGMRAIDKSSPDNNSTRATEFVQANIEFEIKTQIIINTPAYPNRFIRPGSYNVGLENAAAGNGAWPAYGDARFITFGLPNSLSTPPPVSAVDQQASEPTEGNVVCEQVVNTPRRSSARIVKKVKPSKTTVVS